MILEARKGRESMISHDGVQVIVRPTPPVITPPPVKAMRRPGSPDAVRLGCSCCRECNNFGSGRLDGTYRIMETCPVHAGHVGYEKGVPCGHDISQG